MSVNVLLNPDDEHFSRLAAEARAGGTTFEEYLRKNMVEHVERIHVPLTPHQRMTDHCPHLMFDLTRQ